MNLVRVDANDRTVFFMHFSHSPEVLTAMDDIMVELVPIGQSGEPGTRNGCDRAEIKTVDSSIRKFGDAPQDRGIQEYIEA